jgi:ADP-ribose pyrophosphatase YjhB (NUDIX family)
MRQALGALAGRARNGQYRLCVREEQQVVACVALPEAALPEAAAGGPDRTLEACAVVLHGEHPRDAAARAAADDLGLRVEATSLRHVTSLLEDGADGVQRHVLRVVYDAELRQQDVRQQNVRQQNVRRQTTATGASAEPSTDTPAPGTGPMQVQRAGAYAVLAHEGRILLTRLAYTKVWTLPGGGIDHGEDPVDAVCREVHEETGLPLTDARLLDVDSVHFTGHAPDGRLEDFHAVRLLFTGTVPLDVEPRVVELGGSSDAAAWRPIAELDERERRRLAVALSHLP